MPTYQFESIDKEGIYNDIFFTFKDVPRIGTIIEYEGKKWRRIPTIPQAASNTKCDPFSSKDFVEKTGKMKGTWGEMEKLSAEMSEKRAKLSGGEDPVLAKYEAKKEKETGLKSFRKRKNEAKENLAKKGIILE